MPQLTLQQLESHLWGAADILRGAVDSDAYKHYIFALLFYKRLNDVWWEEYEQRLAAYNGSEEMACDPDEHRIDIPEGHFWEDVRRHTVHIGQHLNQAMRAIEDANMELRRVFQDVDFANTDRFSDAMLERLMVHFEKYRLRHADVDADMLGAAYEYLIAQFAENAGKKGGEFFTPKPVVRLIVSCLQIDEGMSVYDPTCGSGGMLLEACKYLERQGKNPQAINLWGQERNLNTWGIAKMNLFLHEIGDVGLAQDDTLLEPKHFTEAGSAGTKGLMTFDRVVANPPFSEKDWGYQVWSKGDPYGRDIYGCPPKSYGDLAFLQHMIASLSATGRLGVVLPHGILFRAGAEGKIREGIIRDDLIEAIIGLGPNLFYGTGIPACIVIINKQKPEARQGRILFINAGREYVEGRNQNHLSDDNIARIVDAYTQGAEEDGFAKFATPDEIADNDHNLNIPRYVPDLDETEDIDVAAELETLNELRAERDAAETRMMDYMKELGYVS